MACANTCCCLGQYCSICGQCKCMCRCAKEMIWPILGPVGWTCPVCNKGNAPHADRCGHCADDARTTYSPGGIYNPDARFTTTLIPPENT